MGIKGLTKFLRTKYPDVYERIHITEYAYQKIAIDTSVYLYKYRAKRGSLWLGSFINLVACLRRNQIHCVFVYDSGAVPEKQRTKDERAGQRQKMKNLISDLELALNEYKDTMIVDENLVRLCNDIKQSRKKAPPRMLGPSLVSDDEDIISVCQLELERLQNSAPRPEDFILTKQLFDILKVPWVDAPLEAETTCSDFCKRGLVAAVLSEDSDVLAYGSTVLLPGLDTTTAECERVKHSDVLESMEMTQNMFLDFCIMCGTDYNANVRGKGPDASFKLIRSHKTIEDVRDSTGMDVEILNHERGREIFTNYEQPDVSIPYCAEPDFDALSNFMAEHDIMMNMQRLKECFAHKKIKFDFVE